MLSLFRSLHESSERAAPAPSERDALVDQSPDAVLALDVDGRITRCNDSAAALFGREQARLLGAPLRNLIVRGDRSVFDKRLDDARALGTQRFDVNIKHDPDPVTIAIAIAPHRAGSGVTVTARDVTMERHANAALTRSESRYRHLFEAASDAIMTFDSLGRFTTVNSAAEQISGYTAPGAHRPLLRPAPRD